MPKKSASYPSRQLDQFVLRMPEGMRERFHQEAEKNRRSMNAEIVDRLEQSFSSVQIPVEMLSKLHLEAARDKRTLQDEIKYVLQEFLDGREAEELLASSDPASEKRRRELAGSFLDANEEKLLRIVQKTVFDSTKRAFEHMMILMEEKNKGAGSSGEA